MKQLLLFVSVLITLFGCTNTDLQPGEGFVNVPGGRVWYRIVGSGTRTPMLVLHGGPGSPSYYLKPLAALAEDRPIVFYDQLGAGHSDRPTDTTLWTIDRFTEELTIVRRALGLTEIHLYGQSWGAILAFEYMLTKPEGVHSLILSSPALSTPRWIHDADSLRTLLPDSIQEIIKRNEKAGTFDSPEYQSAMITYYKHYVARKLPWSADVDSTFAQFGVLVYNYMWGPSEFTATGTLRQYDHTQRLSEIKTPTLFIAGQFDEAVPSTVQYFQSLTPGSQFVVIENSAHLTMQDQPERNNQVIRDFLHGVEQNQK